MRKVTTTMLAMTIALWAEVGLALVAGDQVMQCSMTMQQMEAMGSMTCCPDEDGRPPVLNEERPPCCSVSQMPERPLGFVVNAEKIRVASLDVIAMLPVPFAAPVANHFAIRRSADAPRFVKPVLELKTDLRI